MAPVPLPPSGVGTDVDADVVFDMVYAIANNYILNPDPNIPPFKTIAATPMRVVPPDTDLPHLGVYMREQAKAYTYGIASTPQMWNVLTICCSGIIRYSDAEKQLSVLRALMKGLNTRLLTAPRFNALGVHYAGYTRRFRHAQLNADAIAELALEYNFEYRTVYPPDVRDDYETLHIVRTVSGEAGKQIVQAGTYDVGTGDIISSGPESPGPLPPLITGLDPKTGPLPGDTFVNIGGLGFTGATAVNFGANPAAAFTVLADNLIETTSPAGTGTVDVTVTTPAGVSAIHPRDRFVYLGTTAAAANEET
jgi:hypothetical protein